MQLVLPTYILQITTNTNMLPSTNLQRYTYSITVTIFIADATVHFSESTYIVGENAGKVQPVLVLSNQISFDISIIVESKDKIAIG